MQLLIFEIHLSYQHWKQCETVGALSKSVVLDNNTHVWPKLREWEYDGY
jgi:hypothetical protein